MQFVPFNDFLGKPEELAASVLEELPQQVTSFYRMIGRAPHPPQQDEEEFGSRCSPVNSMGLPGRAMTGMISNLLNMNNSGAPPK